jgi:tetratricopeptide (TPR) repeat protein
VEQAIADSCAVKPALAILDNLETPWRNDERATEALLDRFAAIPGLRLIVTVRGELPVLHGDSIVLSDIEQLDDKEARQLFMRHAGRDFSSDPDLPELVKGLDGHPLSIELLAASAKGAASLANVAADWRARSASKLQRGKGDTRLTSLRVSLDISLKALGVKSAAHRLLRLIALLPAGMAAGDCITALNDGVPTAEEEAAAAKLEAARLLSRRDDRWRLLAPVRETLLQDYPPEAQDKARLIRVFLARAALGRRIDTVGWDEVREGVTAEAGNFDAMIGVAANEPAPPDGLADAATGLAKFHSISGLASVASLIGRRDRLLELVDAILNRRETIILSGARGIGKTTLALAAAHAPAVSAYFGPDQCFLVNLEPVPDAEGVLRALANTLGLDASGAAAAVERSIADFCAAGPALAILDNLETPWGKEKAATEGMLGRLTAIKGLRLIVTVRGEPPIIPGGSYQLSDIERLSLAEAREMFLRYAGTRHASDPALPRLLEALDGHPLLIELLAANAAGKPDLKSLAAEWDEQHAATLQRGDGDTRLTSLRVSLDIALDALGADSAAHRLLRLIALLPAGMAAGDCVAALADGAPTPGERDAAAKLEAARLLSRRDDRWRLLAPVRETLLQDFPPEARDKARLVKLFLARAGLGERIGTAGWDEVRDGVTAEAGNFDAIIGVASNEPAPPDGLADAVRGLAEFHSYTGLASVASLRAAAASLGKIGDVLGEANCIASLGDIALARSDHDGARERHEAALPLYRKVGDVLGEASCIKSLGDIALERSDHDGARERYEAALPLYRKVGAVLGEANCIKSLGDIALRRSDHDGARERYETALPLYRKGGAVLGEANCIRSLGDIALARCDHAGARERYEAALPLYRKFGAVLGEANCIARLGDIALARSDHDAAREKYEAALPLYRKVGDVLGEANCILSLGDIDEANKDMASAQRRWNEALALYGRIAESYQIGLAHLRLTRYAATPAEAAAHREAVRRAWASIGRADLIAKHLDKAP